MHSCPCRLLLIRYLSLLGCRADYSFIVFLPLRKMLQLNFQHQLFCPSRTTPSPPLRSQICRMFTLGFNARQQRLEFKWHASSAGKCWCPRWNPQVSLIFVWRHSYWKQKKTRFEKLMHCGSKRSFWQQSYYYQIYEQVLSITEITDNHGRLSDAAALQKNIWDRPSLTFRFSLKRASLMNAHEFLFTLLFEGNLGGSGWCLHTASGTEKSHEELMRSASVDLHRLGDVIICSQMGHCCSNAVLVTHWVGNGWFSAPCFQYLLCEACEALMSTFGKV